MRRRGGAARELGALAWTLLVIGAVPLVGCGASPSKTRDARLGVAATAAVDHAEIDFGDELTLTLEVRSDPSFEVELPLTASFEGFRSVDQGTIRDQRESLLIDRRWYRLRAERAGSQDLPALTVRHRPAARVAAASGSTGDAAAWSTVTTAPIAITVRSLLPAAASEAPPQIRDIKPLQPIDRPRPWLLVAAAIAVVAALAAGLALAARRRLRRPRPVEPPTPAHLIALAALDRLAATEPSGDEAVRRLHFALSEIVRTYVEGRYGLNATDLTTEEILAALDRLELPEASASSLRVFLRQTDRVKFAAFRPERSEVHAVLERARGFVEQTRPPEQPLPTQAGAREAA